MPGRNGGTLQKIEKGDKALPGAGRPTGSISHSKKFKKFLAGVEEWEVEVDGKMQKMKLTREEILMYRLWDISMNGDASEWGERKGVSLAAIKEIHDRTHGKPPQNTEVTGKDGGAIEVGVNLKALSIEERRALIKLSEKALGNE